VHRNPDAPLLLDLDEIPSPAYHLTGELRGLRRASLELGRGCPFACTFCSTNDYFRRKFRLRSPERVLNEMRKIEVEYGIRDFDLVHDMFTVDARRVRSFCRALIESGEGYTWSCSARTDSVDEELIELMAEAGCIGMFFGVETGSERMQKIIDKHLDTRRAHEIIDITERAGISTTISLITGFPQETWDDLRDTMGMFMHSARAPRSRPQLNLLAPLANTPLHLKYKNEMTLDLLCSDMSHQGRTQNPEDMKLIQKYPEIFPNFYLLPTPHLDRALLLELREFALMATARFRWLLGAVDQATTGVLDIFLDWEQKRQALYPSLVGSQMRHYYRTPQFRLEFTTFLRGHTAGANPVVKTFLDFEDATVQAQSPGGSLCSVANKLERGSQLDWSDLPVREDQSRVIQLSCELQQVIEAVMECREPNWVYGPHFYVVPQTNVVDNSIYHVSPRIAQVLQACDGRRTIYEVVTQLSNEMPDVPQPLRDYIFVGLLEKARAEGLLAIYRTASEPAESQVGGFSIPEYSEMRAAASAQN
jgi:biotin synthase-like enzyme